MGGITDVVRRYVPASYRALVGTTNTYYQSSDLQALADFVQFRIYSTVAGATLEASVYDLEQMELLGMLTTLQFIPAAVDYWGDSLESESTTGTHEVVTYFDRRQGLWKLFDKLTADAADLAQDLGVSIKAARSVVPLISYGDNGKQILNTPDPYCFPDLGSTNRRWPDMYNFNDPGV